MIPLAVVASLTFCSFDYPDKYGVLVKFGEYPKPPSNKTKGDWWAFHTRYGPQPVWDPQMFVAPVIREERIDGTVTDVSEKLIEVRPKGGGDIKKLTPHTLLATGRLPIWIRQDCYCYLLEDIQKGDEVSVGFGKVVPADGDQAFFVMITKRPGGKLPPTRKITLDHPYHLYQQAKNDYEEFGTPLPKHLLKYEKYLKAPPQAKVADPPVAKPTEKVVDGGEKDVPKRPTTKEEFAALAKEGPKPPWMPFIGRPITVTQSIHGTVVKVSRESIEIQLKGKEETAKYPPHTLLDTGAVCHWQFDSQCYLLDDVKKGDVVVLGVGTVDKDKGPECFWLSIRERPGGVVPVSRKPSFPKAYHQEQQKEIDDARNGIPKKEKPSELLPPKKD